MAEQVMLYIWTELIGVASRARPLTTPAVVTDLNDDAVLAL